MVSNNNCPLLQFFLADAMTVQLRRSLTAVILLLLLATSNVLAAVTASTNRSVLTIDETINLEIQSKNSSGEPDLSVLETDFQILGTSRSQNYSLINGRSSRTHTWNVTLLPKKIGEVTIPVITVGDESTDPIHLVVQKQSSTPGLDGKDVFLKIEVADNQGNDFYVQQQILIKVQLYHRIRFTNATLSDLELDNTVIEKLGNDSNYSKVIAKNRYNVIEKNYALYPQQSGPLTIPALTFSGHTEISQNFSLFSRPGQQIISRTKPVTLNILPIPETFTGKNWLPAEALELEANILEDIDNITAGEAITRHIVVRATGLLASQLPASNMHSTANLKVYPDKEKLNTQLLGDKVVGTRRDTIAIIPVKPGSFTLPEIRIDWWNIRTNQQETTTLPARVLTALPNGEITAPETDNQPIATTTPANNAATDDVKEKTVEKIVYKQLPITRNIWFWISLALLILWLMTLALAATWRTRNNVTTDTAVKPVSNSHEKHLQNLYDACHNNDAHQSTQALIVWARSYFKSPLLSGLSQLLERIDNEALINAVNKLEQVQYSGARQDWNGEELSTAVHDFIHQGKTKHKAGEEQVFAPLNP